MPSAWRMLALLAIFALAAVSGAAQNPAPQKTGKSDGKPAATPAIDAAALAKAASDDPDYVIGSEDVLSVNVWKEPEVTKVVPVRPDGKISLPLLNDVQAAGLTPQQLAAAITEGLKKFMAGPQVTIIVTAANSRRFYIMGEVGHPGTFPLQRGMTVLQGLAGAGAFTQFANVKGIYILRNEGGKQVRYPFNYRQVIKGKNEEQNMVLKPGDTIVVP
jgi:polysaccharide export outer membrane protein